MYRATSLWTTVTVILRDLKIDDKYTVLDVRSFGYDPESDPLPSIWVEVYTRDSNGEKTGTEIIKRWIHYDKNYADWGKPPEDYPVIA
jgi:hypothetical protein